MRVLFLSARFPYPPHRGDRLTTHHLLRTFSRRHEVELVSFADGTEPPEALQNVAKLCSRVESVALSRSRSWLQAWSGLPSAVPSQVSFYRSAAMTARVRSLIDTGNYDVVFAQLVRMAPHVSAVRGPAKVLFMGDSLSMALGRSLAYEPSWKRPGVQWERRRLDRYEVDATHWFDETWLLSPVDLEDLRARGGVRLALTPHGVDERLFDIPLSSRSSKDVFFLGNLSVPHNIDAARWLARDIWPGIHAAVPGARLILGGADPTPEVRALAKLNGVSVPGAVPDLLDTWRSVAVLVAPLRFSTGIQNKVIEAMAAGVPVITTPAVATGLGEGSAHLVQAGTVEDTVEQTARVLAQPDLQLETVRRARAFVKEHFTWELLERRLVHVVERRREKKAG